MKDPLDSLEQDSIIGDDGSIQETNPTPEASEPVSSPEIDSGMDEVTDDDEVEPVVVPSSPEPEVKPEVTPEVDISEDGTEEVVESEGPATDVPTGNYNGRTYVFPDIVTFNNGMPTVEQTRTYYVDREPKAGEEVLSMSNLPPGQISRLATDYSEQEDRPTTTIEATWHRLGLSALHNLPTCDTLIKALTKEGSNYRQGYNLGKNLFLLAAVRPSENSTATTGEAARMRVLDAFDVTGRVESFLPSSGFWIRMIRPSDSELNMLYELVMEDQMANAYRTYGRSYANYRSLLIGHLMDFIYDHVRTVYTDIGPMEPKEFLLENVSSDDHDYLIWMMLTLVWPDGWVYQRQVAADVSDPFKVIIQTLNLRTIMHVDESKFTPTQLRYISETRRKASTVEQRNRYLSEFKRPNETYMDPSDYGIKMRHKLRFVIRSPSTSDLVASGELWLRTITRMWEDAALEENTRDRQTFIRREMSATRLRIYEHWIQAIELYNSEDDTLELSLTDREDIAANLNDLSSNNELFLAIQDAVAKHIVETTLYVVGVPIIDKRYGEETLPSNPFIMPLDLANAFFTMLGARVTDI